MCDYSLASFKSRLAVQGETLNFSVFPMGSVGLVSPQDLGVAVCVPPGAWLQLVDIPVSVQAKHRISACEEAMFIQTDLESNRHRDAVIVGGSKRISLQEFYEGGSVTILSLKNSEEREPAPAEYGLVLAH